MRKERDQVLLEGKKTNWGDGEPTLREKPRSRLCGESDRRSMVLEGGGLSVLLDAILPCHTDSGRESRQANKVASFKASETALIVVKKLFASYKGKQLAHWGGLLGGSIG